MVIIHFLVGRYQHPLPCPWMFMNVPADCREGCRTPVLLEEAMGVVKDCEISMDSNEQTARMPLSLVYYDIYTNG